PICRETISHHRSSCFGRRKWKLGFKKVQDEVDHGDGVGENPSA
uniref:Uncharacterized protein n=1 Tax=Aegilops tauschii subsp. strangulata TaxID=200361 RepID=A0A453EY34_AEGTS